MVKSIALSDRHPSSSVFVRYAIATASATLGEVTHLYQRRASCCRYYLLPRGSLCACCPLVSQKERERRNLEWMKKRRT
jgi:hypothetical protein